LRPWVQQPPYPSTSTSPCQISCFDIFRLLSELSDPDDLIIYAKDNKQDKDYLLQEAFYIMK
jgi:hypothetical protein